MVSRVQILFVQNKTNSKFSIIWQKFDTLALVTGPLVHSYSYIFLSSLKKKSINYWVIQLKFRLLEGAVKKGGDSGCQAKPSWTSSVIRPWNVTGSRSKAIQQSHRNPGARGAIAPSEFDRSEAFFSRLQNRGVQNLAGVKIFPQHAVFIAQHAFYCTADARSDSENFQKFLKKWLFWTYFVPIISETI